MTSLSQHSPNFQSAIRETVVPSRFADAHYSKAEVQVTLSNPFLCRPSAPQIDQRPYSRAVVGASFYVSSHQYINSRA